MTAVDAIHKVGEGPPQGKGPSQGEIGSKGNAYLDAKFPMLTKIVSMRITAAPDT